MLHTPPVIASTVLLHRGVGKCSVAISQLGNDQIYPTIVMMYPHRIIIITVANNIT
jgi:hypothetical protein